MNQAHLLKVNNTYYSLHHVMANFIKSSIDKTRKTILSSDQFVTVFYVVTCWQTDMFLSYYE
jgi:hypothetical protein